MHNRFQLSFSARTNNDSKSTKWCTIKRKFTTTLPPPHRTGSGRPPPDLTQWSNCRGGNGQNVNVLYIPFDLNIKTTVHQGPVHIKWIFPRWRAMWLITLLKQSCELAGSGHSVSHSFWRRDRRIS